MSNAQKNLVIARSVVDQGLSIAQVATKIWCLVSVDPSLSRRWYCSGPTAVSGPKISAPDHQHHGACPHCPATSGLDKPGDDAGPVTFAWHLERVSKCPQRSRSGESYMPQDWWWPNRKNA